MRVKAILPIILLLLMIVSAVLPPNAYAADDEIIAVEEGAEEIVALEEPEEIQLIDGELPAYQYRMGLRELPENVSWENGRLLLNFSWALIEEVGVQHGGQACACFSLAYCRTILDGISYPYSDFSLGTSEEDAYAGWHLAAYAGYFPSDKQSAYERIFSELCHGKPVVVRVEGAGSILHYVAIVGFENVTDGLPLSAYNFLILDPGVPSYEIENMGDRGFDLKKDRGKYQVEFDTTSAASPFLLENSDYLRNCSEAPAHLYLTAREQTYVMSLPCDRETCSETREFVALRKGERFFATAIIENSRLETWYKGKTESGVSGYVYAGAMEKEDPIRLTAQLGNQFPDYRSKLILDEIRIIEPF